MYLYLRKFSIRTWVIFVRFCPNNVLLLIYMKTIFYVACVHFFMIYPYNVSPVWSRYFVSLLKLTDATCSPCTFLYILHSNYCNKISEPFIRLLGARLWSEQWLGYGMDDRENLFVSCVLWSLDQLRRPPCFLCKGRRVLFLV